MWRHKCGAYEVRHGGMMQVLNGTAAMVWDADADEPRVTIVALNLTCKESAADLQRLAEVYEVREASVTLPMALVVRAMGPIDDPLTADGIGSAAERLHAVGWRPGMSAEDAARLLSVC